MQLGEERSDPCLTAPGRTDCPHYNTGGHGAGSLYQRSDHASPASGPLKQLSLETVLTQSDLKRLLRILAADPIG
ncbi:MAG: hypothetical protein HQL60_08625 [Magnetococcales bacterium]|nr:hypothetical protein [Magnetococcales bacterium]